MFTYIVYLNGRYHGHCDANNAFEAIEKIAPGCGMKPNWTAERCD